MDEHSTRMAELHGQLEDVKGAAVTLGYDRELYRDLLRLFAQRVYGEDLSIDEISRRLDPDGDYEPQSVDTDKETSVTFVITTQEGEETTYLNLPATTPYPRNGETVYVDLPASNTQVECEVTGHTWNLTGGAGDAEGEQRGSGTMYLEIHLSEVPSA